MRKITCLLATALGIGSLTVHAVRASEVAAYVVDYSSDRGAVDIERGTTLMPIEIGAPLEVGDVVRVAGSASAKIEDGRGRTILVVAAASPFTIERVGAFGAMRGKFDQIMQIIRWQAHEAPIAARTRDSGRLTVPLLDLAAPAQKVVAGPREFVLECFDGLPPFHWSVLAHGAVVAEQLAASGRRTVIAGTLAPGPAELRVSDRTGSIHAFALEVVGSLPPDPARLVAQAHTSLERIRAAAMLTSFDGGAFTLEAIALLSKPGATRAEAELLAALEMGERP